MSEQVYIQTFGCQMNEYDSAKMADVLGQAMGVTETRHPDEADILLLNSCSVREKAQEKVFSLLGRWRAYKREQPHKIIGVGGCVASQEGEAIRRRAPYVDLVFGPQTLHRLPEMIAQVRTGSPGVVDVSFPEIEKFDRLPAATDSPVTAFVSVMEGCSKYCTFCVVPYTRGEEISRPLDDVIVEIAGLAGLGVKEINLLGQNVNAYRGPVHGGGTADLATLIHYVAAIEGIRRIRFTTSHPVEFSPSLVQAYGQVGKLASYLHLPVQSGSDRILGLMKRGYTTASYLEKIPCDQAGPARNLDIFGLHRRFPGRRRVGFSGHPRPDRGGGFRSILQLHLQSAPGYSGRRGTRRGVARSQTGAAPAASGAGQRTGGRHQPGHGRAG